MANTKIPSEQVEKLLSKGKSHGGVLTYREIMDSMQNAEDMSADDMDSMYELIAQKGIDVVDDANDDLDLEPEAVSEADEINEAELANMSVPEGVSIDDPVRMYLKEIGRVPLLVGEDEVKLAKRMDKGKQAYRLLHGTRHGVVAPVYTGKDSTQELIAKARELIKDEKTICDLRSITKALQFIEAREKSGNPCTIEEYKALVADFTRDECMRLHKLLQDEHITISGSEKVTPDAHTSDKEIHSLFDLKTILEEVKRRLPEEKDTAVFDAYLEFKAFIVIEFFNCFNKAEIAFLNQVEELQAAVRVLFGYGNYEAQVCAHHFGFRPVGLAHVNAHFLDQIYELRGVEPVGFADFVEALLDLGGVADSRLFAYPFNGAQFVLAILYLANDWREVVEEFLENLELEF